MINERSHSVTIFGFATCPMSSVNLNFYGWYFLFLGFVSFHDFWKQNQKQLNGADMAEQVDLWQAVKSNG